MTNKFDEWWQKHDFLADGYDAIDVAEFAWNAALGSNVTPNVTDNIEKQFGCVNDGHLKCNYKNGLNCNWPGLSEPYCPFWRLIND
jgi:hypothetical protein